MAMETTTALRNPMPTNTTSITKATPWSRLRMKLFTELRTVSGW